MSLPRVIALSGLVVCMLAAWPAWRFYTAALSDSQYASALLEWTKTVVADLPAQAEELESTPEAVNVTQVLTESLADFPVLVERVNPENDGSVAVWFQQTEHAEFVRWLTYLEGERGLTLVGIRVEKLSTPGWARGSLVVAP